MYLSELLVCVYRNFLFLVGLAGINLLFSWVRALWSHLIVSQMCAGEPGKEGSSLTTSKQPLLKGTHWSALKSRWLGGWLCCPLLRAADLAVAPKKHESLFVLSLNLYLYLSLKLSLARLDSRNVKAWLEKICWEISCTVTEIGTYLAGERKRFYPSLPSYKNIRLNQKFKFKILRETTNIHPTINKYLFTSVRVEIIEDLLEADMRPDRLLLANDWRL